MQAIDARTQAVSTDELALRLGAVMKHLMTATGRDFFAEMERLGLGLSQVKVLQNLADAEEPLSVKAVAGNVGMSLAGISRSADRLCKAGFVAREEDPDDRRSKHLTLTAKGQRALDGLLELRLAGLRDWVATLSEDEARALAQGLEPIVQRDDVAAHILKRRSRTR